MVHHLILGMEESIAALEANDILTESYLQLVINIRKMLETMCSEFKAYHYKLWLALKLMKPQDKNKCSLVNTNGRLWSSLPS